MQFHMRNVILSKSPLISSVVLMLYFALYSPSISLSSLIPIVLLSGRSSRSACLISSTPLLRLSVTVVIHCSALSGFVLMFSFAASSRIILPEMLCPSLSCILAENRLRSSTAADFFAVLAYSSRLAILRLRRTVSSLLSASCSRHLISCPAVIWLTVNATSIIISIRTSINGGFTIKRTSSTETAPICRKYFPAPNLSTAKITAKHSTNIRLSLYIRNAIKAETHEQTAAALSDFLSTDSRYSARAKQEKASTVSTVSPESQLFIIFIVPNAAVAVSLNTRYISDNSYSFRYAFETTDFLPKSAALASIISNV